MREESHAIYSFALMHKQMRKAILDFLAICDFRFRFEQGEFQQSERRQPIKNLESKSEIKANEPCEQKDFYYGRQQSSDQERGGAHLSDAVRLPARS